MNSGHAVAVVPIQVDIKSAVILKLRGEPGGDPTPQEMEIISLKAGGKANKEIAEILGITRNTVETHITNIYRRMGWNSIVELVHWALNEGITANKFAKQSKRQGCGRSQIESFFVANLGRKFAVNSVTEVFGESVRDKIRELNCGEHRKVTILTEGGYFWALEA